ncbi:MAG: TIGR03621 family F420-dependent LLM class oxidoreductase [Chloroflexi bacterium]|nr:TIGR03621 family F420-dependent LLM class oxidoreductase [Chloroflexota bacterium]
MTPLDRRFRFGVLLSRAESAAEWRELARKTEDLGYSTLLIADHFGRQLAPLPALVAAASATSRLRVGTFVLDNDFRHPAATAKEAATVDVLTGGRLELGIGAGWNPADYQKAGLTFESAGTRVGRLEEAVQIIKMLFEGGEVDFEGRYYQLEGLEGQPLPVQRPRPPIMIGAAGRRMLRLAAREADILNFPDRPSVGVSTAGNPGLGLTMAEQMQIVRSSAGERYAALELSSLSIPRLTSDVAGVIETLATQMRTTPEVVKAMPGTLVGSREAIVDKLRANREQWDISYPVIPGAAIDSMAPIVAELAGT